MASVALQAQLKAHFTAKHLPPSTPWLTHFLSTQKPTTPLPSLIKTADFRLLASDITTSLDNAAHFPTDILDGTRAERILSGSIPVQLLEVQDVGRSAWGQLEALEAVERGETTVGREIVRTVPGEVEGGEEAGKRGGPFKVLLQDAKGARVYGFEIADVQGLSVGRRVSMGVKMMLQNAVVARGVVLLSPESCVVLGGRIEVLEKRWNEGRKEELKRQVGLKGRQT